uniref:Uncharacterized protein n=1 Tax=Sphaerodactylus townsendi TaxID=933632 RepID=A0ACB8EQI4_9SAUR
MFLSAQVHCLLCDILAQKIIGLSSGMSKPAMPELGGHIPDFDRGKHTIPRQRDRNFLVVKHMLSLEDSLAEGTAQQLGDCIYLQLVSFLQEASNMAGVLPVLQEDLEWAKVHAQNILPLEENTSATVIVTDLLAMVNAQTAAAETAVQNSFRMYSSQLALCSFMDKMILAGQKHSSLLLETQAQAGGPLMMTAQVK